MNQLNEHNFIFSAQCDPKGKVWSNLLLFKRGDDIYYLQRKSVIDVQLNELKKYAIFSKVSFELDTNLKIVGLAGNDKNDILANISTYFSDQQNCVTVGNITYLKITFPTVRYIMIVTQAELDSLQLDKYFLAQNSEQWQLLDMEANYPIIDLPVSNQYLPQAFNLQNFAAISFDKGCYCGQEMVARAQYRGINKRALYLLTGHSEQLPQIGETLEQQIGENWRETGCVLATLRLDNDIIWVQAVLNSDLDSNTRFRIKNYPDSELSINNKTID